MKKLFYSIIIIITLSMLTNCVIITRKKLADEYFDIANSLVEAGADNLALEYYQKARKLSRSTNKTLYNLSRLYLLQGNTTEALAVAQELYRKDKDNNLLKELLAYCYYRSGYRDKALEIYEELNTLLPRSRNLYNTAQIYLENEDVDTALSLLQQAAVLDEENSSVFLLYAEVLTEQGNREDAFKQLLAFQNLRPDPSTDSTKVAMLLERNERYQEARQVYDAISLPASKHTDAEKAEAHFNSARLLFLKEKNSEQGLSALEQALMLGYRDIAALRTLRNDPKIFVSSAIDVLLARYSVTLVESPVVAPSQSGGQTEPVEEASTPPEMQQPEGGESADNTIQESQEAATEPEESSPE